MNESHYDGTAVYIELGFLFERFLLFHRRRIESRFIDDMSNKISGSLMERPELVSLYRMSNVKFLKLITEIIIPSRLCSFIIIFV